MKLLLAITLLLTVGQCGLSQVHYTDTLKEVFHEVGKNGHLLEIRRLQLLFDSNGYEYKNVDTTIISNISTSDTLSDTTYWPISLLFGGYEEKMLRTVTKSVVTNGELFPVENFEHCLNGQLIEHLPNPKGGYVKYYCNGTIKEKSDSCKYFGPTNCIPIGYTQFFYPNGTIWGEGILVNDLPDDNKYVQSFNVGEWKYYNEQGKLHKKVLHDDFGRVIKEEEIKN